MVSTSLPPTRAGIPSPPTPTTHRTTAPGNGCKALPGRKLPATSTRGTGLSLRRMLPGRSPHTTPTASTLPAAGRGRKDIITSTIHMGMLSPWLSWKTAGKSATATTHSAH